jgi:hypothetical protein
MINSNICLSQQYWLKSMPPWLNMWTMDGISFSSCSQKHHHDGWMMKLRRVMPAANWLIWTLKEHDISQPWIGQCISQMVAGV